MEHIVFYSGGLGSWATAKRVVERHGKENVILLFTDTLMEDEDLYRFLFETSEEMGIPITWLEDGRLIIPILPIAQELLKNRNKEKGADKNGIQTR